MGKMLLVCVGLVSGCMVGVGTIDDDLGEETGDGEGSGEGSGSGGGVLDPSVDGDADGVLDGIDNCPGVANPAQLDSEICVWPNRLSQANSDPWIAQHHDQLRVMRPKFLVINFANGIGLNGNDELLAGSAFSEQQLRTKAESFVHALRQGSRYQPRRDAQAPAFLQPEIVKVVDMQDTNGHVNSALFPRGQLIPNTPGYRTVGYYQLFGQTYAPKWGYMENGRYLTLGEILDRGLVHEVIMIANQVDGRAPNPPAEVTSNILEVAFTAQAYSETFAPRPGEFVKNGTPYERQKIDMAQATADDHNSMPFTGRSLRVYFMNASRGVGCLLHSLGHEFEFRYNESRIYSPNAPYDGQTPHPYMQPLFRKFADFDMQERYGAPFASLYAGGQGYSLTNCTNGICSTLNHGTGSITNFAPRCGNTHYTPSSVSGYEYAPPVGVMSACESFQKPASAATPVSKASWAYLTSDTGIDQDCGGDFLVYWYQNMPGFQNQALDLAGAPMKNWWPFMYY